MTMRVLGAAVLGLCCLSVLLQTAQGQLDLSSSNSGSSSGSSRSSSRNTVNEEDLSGLSESRQDMVIAQQQESNQGGYDPMTSRIMPRENEELFYTVTSQRLDEIRARLMYPYYDMDHNDQDGDYQHNVNNGMTMLPKQLSFLMPFFGFGLNYTWVSLNGHLGFSDAPVAFRSYPLQFPIPQWPSQPDPSFIGIFYSKCSIGQLRPEEEGKQQKPGVYFRLMRELPARTDRLYVELRERIKWDVRTGIVGAEIFEPKHLVIVTWKNVTFAGGYVNSDANMVTNTFQLLLVTDEVRTYAIFNYELLNWMSHTEAGGSADLGQGGTPAFVGFNAGNGTRAFEYKPYSQLPYIHDLTTAGKANGIPGRHIFRVDEQILPGCCRREEQRGVFPLTFSPDHANMMGGTLVNITGPCFSPGDSIKCQFDTTTVEGNVIGPNTAVCITPPLLVTGYVIFSMSVNLDQYKWRGRFLIETPLTAVEQVWFTDKSFESQEVEVLNVNWLAGNLTQTRGTSAQLSIWGYKEKTINPEIIYIDMIATSVSNDDRDSVPFTIDTSAFANRDNYEHLDLEMGFLMINLTTPEPAYGLAPMQTQLWSRPIPLAWYFSAQWKDHYGDDWPVAMCDRWTEFDRNLRNFAFETQRCPCLLKQAVADRGRFLPDFTCDIYGNTECDNHWGAIHCVRTALANQDGAGQQCCYARNGYLMMSADQMWAGSPHRAHNFGQPPFDEAVKVPSLSHWYYDVMPFYTCCLWQGEQSSGCTTFRFERRASQDCVGYQPPGVATTFGDPHFYTFDNVAYTFNGKGEYVLTRVDSNRGILDVQGRFEQIPENELGQAKATTLTAVAARDNTSSIIEIRRRPLNARWRYHMDVLVDGRLVYFDRYAKKIQRFKNSVVYTPSNVLNQSHVVVMFSSGAGLEVQQNNGFLTTRVYLPLIFANSTKGLFGNWSFRADDDFVVPGNENPLPVSMANDSKALYTNFGQKWALDDSEGSEKGVSLFTHTNSRSASYYHDANFNPEYDMNPVLSPNASLKMRDVDSVCGASYQCRYDYIVSLRRDVAVMTKFYQDQFINIRTSHLAPVIPCGALPTPPHGRKSTFNFLAGAEVKFDCEEGFVLLGEQRRWCYSSGDWNWPENGEATCVTEEEYQSMQAGITAGTVLAVLIPVLLALACFVAHKRAEFGEEDEYTPPKQYWPPTEMQPRAPQQPPRGDGTESDV